MGYEMHTAFERREEWNAARLGEVEFKEMARALKKLAHECDVAPEQVIDCLAGKGLAEALAMLANRAGNNMEAGYYRYRATSGDS